MAIWVLEQQRPDRKHWEQLCVSPNEQGLVAGRLTLTGRRTQQQILGGAPFTALTNA